MGDNEEKEKTLDSTNGRCASKSSSPHSANSDEQDFDDEHTRKRRRNSDDKCETNVGCSENCKDEIRMDDHFGQPSADDGASNLTMKNVADHEKRCEEVEREKKKSEQNPVENFQSTSSKRKSTKNVTGGGLISMDEVVDNFSTMATDGSRHSLCGSCEDEKNPSDRNSRTVVSKSEDTTAAASQNSLAVEFEKGETDKSNNVIDEDGNILNPDDIGEPREPLLRQWDSTSSNLSIRSPIGETSRSDPENESSMDSSILAGSPTGLFYEATSSTPTRDAEDSMGGISDRMLRYSSSSDREGDGDDSSMLTTKSDDGTTTAGSTTALDNANWAMPTHKWNAVKTWRNREFGFSSTQSPDWFRYRANGSLHFLQRLELMYKMETHEGCVNCLHFNGSGTRLASGSDDLNIVIWDWAINRPLLTIESGHRANVFQAKFMPLSGDCHIVSCARDGQVRLAELSVRGICKSTRKLAQHRGSSHKLALEPDSPHTFLSCGDDAVVFELDLRDPKPNKLLMCTDRGSRPDRAEKVALYSIHSHPRNPYYFATSGRDPFCRLYDKRMIADGKPVKKFCPQHLLNDDSHKTNVTAVVFNYDGSELLGSYNDDDIYLFGTNQSNENEYKHRYKGHRNNATVKGVNFYGPQSEFIVSGSDCGYIYFWEKESETIVQYLPGDEGGVVNVLEPHPTCAFLATSGLDHDVKIWVPSCEDPKFDVNKLQKLMKRNARDRERDRRNEPGEIDSEMLYYIMSRFRRAARRADRPDGTDESDDTDHSDNSDEDTGDGQVAVQCRPS